MQFLPSTCLLLFKVASHFVVTDLETDGIKGIPPKAGILLLAFRTLLACIEDNSL